MQPAAFAAIAVVTVCTFVLYVLGRRFTRGYVARYRQMPRLAWMLQRTDDPDLEATRRLALGIAPVYLVALAVYLLRP
jgi:hypothetical protein